MSNIWFTSDTHFGHKNISSVHESQWKSGYRNFNNLHHHNSSIVDNINKYVKEDDILYHLGDWSFGGINNVWEFRKRLVCKNIHLILGNHDHHIEANKQIPLSQQSNWQDNKYLDKTMYDLFSSVQHYKEVNINKL